nr:chaperone protein DnaJ 11, chloroplastic-like [Ipomoea batatas]
MAIGPSICTVIKHRTAALASRMAVIHLIPKLNGNPVVQKRGCFESYEKLSKVYAYAATFVATRYALLFFGMEFLALPRSSPVCAVATAAYAEEETEAAAFSSSPPLHPEIESPSSATSFYEILGIPVGATSEEIKAAYRRLARVCHPDVAGSRRKDASGDEFMKIHTAYSTLSDPDKRADYDRQLFLRRRSVNLYSSPTMSSRFTGNSRRNWETDQCW